MRILWLSICLVLPACNFAVSDHPMLASEPASTIGLKDGLWAADDPKCTFNAKRPANRWPKCAFWLVFSGGKIVGATDAKPTDLPLELVITEGKPPLVEFPLKEQNEKEAKSFAYIAIDPAKTDSEGRTIDVQGWIVACGIDESEKLPRTGTATTIKHFAGMDKDCHPQSVDALRAAAARGPQGSKKFRWRWIRAAAN